MGWSMRLGILVLLVLDVLLVEASDQQPLSTSTAIDRQKSWLSRPWYERPDGDATGNLIFQSLAGLMQMKANSKHPNGHAIVRASIPPGTTLYHGRRIVDYPIRDWIGLDPEHSTIFTGGPNGTLFTFSTVRELTLLYFDGCSANKVDGVVDTQDLLFWGKLKRDHHGWWGEMDRIEDGCAWAKQYGIDGFVRMEFDFEIMYCDFSDGLELVSVASPVSGQPIKSEYFASNETHRPGDQPFKAPLQESRSEATFHGLRRSDYPGDGLEGPDRSSSILPPLVPPPGWKGSFPLTFTEATRAGTWHNDFPGELRVRPDPSAMVSFFDASLPSLVKARRSMTRDEYVAGNISREDVVRVRADVAEMAAREPGTGSGVDWIGLSRVVEERFKDRLPYLRHLLHQPVVNASEQAAVVRKQLFISLNPYMYSADVGAPEWFADIARECAMRFTAGLPVSRFTKQEHLLHHAVDEVLHETCRVYTAAWVDAFDVEAQSRERAAGLLAKWRDEFDTLIEWLDWPVWIQCHPACAVNEYCYVSQGRPWALPDGHQSGHEPQCLPMEDRKL